MALLRFVVFTVLACISSGMQQTNQHLKSIQTLAKFSFGDSVYELIGNQLNWDEAKYNCKIMGMDLASIESREENEVLRNETGLYPEYSFWISGNNLYDIDEYVWESTGKALLYTNWAPGEPKDLDYYRCIYMHQTKGNWTNYACSGTAFRSICESPSTMTCSQCPLSDVNSTKFVGV